MDEAEEKVKEEIEIKKEEIEGAIEDLEDTIKQLQELNDEYEEMIDEMHENDLEKITYRLEFELELNELDTEWNDFLLEQIDNDFTQAAAIMDLVTNKAKTATENIEHYKQSVTDLIENIENDPNRSLITGYIEDGVLTEDEAEIIKEAYSGIIEELNNLAEAKTTAEELLVSIFEGYSERIDMDMTALEHYSTLMEHFGNVVDIVG
jgi:DNA repair exonuclease SbcCD ATPase subunit